MVRFNNRCKREGKSYKERPERPERKRLRSNDDPFSKEEKVRRVSED